MASLSGPWQVGRTSPSQPSRSRAFGYESSSHLLKLCLESTLGALVGIALRSH